MWRSRVAAITVLAVCALAVPAHAEQGNGLYEPFPSVAKGEQGNGNDYFGRLGLHVSPRGLGGGAFGAGLSPSGGAAVASHRAGVGGTSTHPAGLAAVLAGVIALAAVASRRAPHAS